MSETAIRHHLHGGEPKLSSLRAIARATKFSAQWLVEGEEQEGSRSDATNVAALNDLLKILVRRINAEIRHRNDGYGQRHVAYVRVNGDGMLPTLLLGELVSVNMAIQTLSDGLHLLSIHGRQLVRRVNVLTSGFEISGDNQKYKARTYTAEEIEARGLAYSA